MSRKIVLLSLVLALLLPLASHLVLKAQEGQQAMFGPQDVFPHLTQALSVADLLIADDGSVLSAAVQNAQFTLRSPTFGQRGLRRDEIVAIVFRDEEKQISEDQVFLRTGEKAVGRLSLESLDVELVLSERATLDIAPLKAVLFRLPTQSSPSRIDFRPAMRQVFGLFHNVLVSVTQFDTLVFSNGQVASVALDDRDNLSFTFNSSFFGSYTFTPGQIAWVLFGSRADQLDQLALKNGDRVSGVIAANQGLLGRLILGGVEFSLTKDEVKTELRQIMFKIPVRLFGGGGGPPREPIED